MPLTSKGNKVLNSMQRHYGKNKGESVFYASINSGKIIGAHPRGKGGAGGSPLKFRKREGGLGDCS